MTNGTPAPGWYADPRDPGRVRWWNGSGWTGHTQPMPGSAPAAPTPAPAPAAPAPSPWGEQPAAQQPGTPPPWGQPATPEPPAQQPTTWDQPAAQQPSPFGQPPAHDPNAAQWGQPAAQQPGPFGQPPAQEPATPQWGQAPAQDPNAGWGPANAAADPWQTPAGAAPGQPTGGWQAQPGPAGAWGAGVPPAAVPPQIQSDNPVGQANVFPTAGQVDPITGMPIQDPGTPGQSSGKRLAAIIGVVLLTGLVVLGLLYFFLFRGGESTGSGDSGTITEAFTGPVDASCADLANALTADDLSNTVVRTAQRCGRGQGSRGEPGLLRAVGQGHQADHGPVPERV